jgi:hypothetical protein
MFFIRSVLAVISCTSITISCSGASHFNCNEHNPDAGTKTVKDRLGISKAWSGYSSTQRPDALALVASVTPSGAGAYTNAPPGTRQDAKDHLIVTSLNRDKDYGSSERSPARRISGSFKLITLFSGLTLGPGV